jgi:hypothetical protein
VEYFKAVGYLSMIENAETSGKCTATLVMPCLSFQACGLELTYILHLREVNNDNLKREDLDFCANGSELLGQLWQSKVNACKVTSLAMTLLTSKLLTTLNQRQERRRSRKVTKWKNHPGKGFQF